MNDQKTSQADWERREAAYNDWFHGKRGYDHNIRLAFQAGWEAGEDSLKKRAQERIKEAWAEVMSKSRSGDDQIKLGSVAVTTRVAELESALTTLMEDNAALDHVRFLNSISMPDEWGTLQHHIGMIRLNTYAPILPNDAVREQEKAEAIRNHVPAEPKDIRTCPTCLHQRVIKSDCDDPRHPFDGSDCDDR